MANENFPAKHVNIRSNDRKRGNPSPIFPSPKTWFFSEKSTIKKHLRELITQIEFILDNELDIFDNSIKDNEYYPFPVIIELQDNRIAKNHRPTLILGQIDSDIIAIQDIGKLIISASRASLETLVELIYDVLEEVPNHRMDWLITKDDREIVTKSKEKWYEIIHQLTCIKQFKLYSHNEVEEFMDENSMSNIRNDKEFKVRFFNYGDDELNQIVISTFLRSLKDYGLNRNKVRKINYIDLLDVYAVPYLSDDLVKLASHFPGVESISNFTYFESVSQEPLVEDEVVEILQPIAGQEYPRIAIVDSGIGKENPYLQPWVEAVDNYVIEGNQDNYHGEFIAGIINYGHILNENIKNVVDSGVKLLDVTILPDIKKERVREDDLLASLEQALEVYADKYKVWNLSLASDRVCDGYVSEFTAAIDAMQKRFNVLFVIAAGNTKSSIINRITSPADSIRAVTVGSIAIDSSDQDQVERNVVLPYSRKGPGVGLSIKPDIVHFSGNPSKNPIYSLNSSGEKVGDYGTSFSTPLVSAILGEYFSLYPNNMTPLMAKTLLIHGGQNPVNKNRIKDIATHYEYGYGLPRRIADILYGDEHEITLLFEGDIDSSSGTNWIKIDQFPFPKSFYNQESQKIKGNILITLGYDTPLNARYGSEYCRSNLDVRIRTRIDDSFKKITNGSKTESNFDAKWERDRITSESKWSNIKQVEFKSPNGRKGTNELILEVLPNWRNIEEKIKVPFVIVLTIKDPKGELPIYNEVTQQLNASFAINDIKLKNAPIRVDF
ncbi:S8 family peptidase [Rummeliibacillus suwonensis]|uniref:S8 family peptidase n=1 Tax=Rummeliibacillus suwonensis TaxID=1306154 RepID=UPI0011B65708|nr:S8 family peptidase [Rummeliibacillus suwonensis]